MNSLENTRLAGTKIAIEFSGKLNRIKGVAVLLFVKGGYAKSLGRGRYVVSEDIGELLKEKGVVFSQVPLPAK